MAGLPGGEPGATHPNWIVNAWNSAVLDVVDDQLGIAADFSREKQADEALQLSLV